MRRVIQVLDAYGEQVIIRKATVVSAISQRRTYASLKCWAQRIPDNGTMFRIGKGLTRKFTFDTVALVRSQRVVPALVSGVQSLAIRTTRSSGAA